ncbi:MAG: hypothetical protein ACI81P_000796 [Neolewinella sp.]|jgi:hypothetical protein
MGEQLPQAPFAAIFGGHSFDLPSCSHFLAFNEATTALRCPLITQTLRST